MKTIKKQFEIIIPILLFMLSVNIHAQKGFSLEVSVGSTLGHSSELYTYTLQGNAYYLWGVSGNIDLGVTTGALVFLGDASEDWCDGCQYDDFEAELYVPLAIAGRANLSKNFAAGIDIGYAFLIHIFDAGGGFYFRPVIAYKLKEKLAIIGSYCNINENGYIASSINLGINFGF